MDWRRARGWLEWRVTRAWVWVRPHLGVTETCWSRVVMDRATADLVRALPYQEFDALEVSGRKWRDFGFRSYQQVDYPAYDVCEGSLDGAAFDLVIAEQVLEHVLRPLRAVEHVRQMLKPGGAFLVTTPFLLRVHQAPIDCTRWTETGLRALLAEAGFDPASIVTGSWGNRACVVGNFRTWRLWVRWLHSLRNEPDFPVHVWAIAHRD
jgi:SAM-dependent methyltransferase